ncbi:MAG: tetratricopeptide repeat protein [Balneola sp.]
MIDLSSKLLAIFIISLATQICLFGQTVDSLNNLSKDFLNKGNFKEALPHLEKAAKLGHFEAQYNLGYLYQIGQPVEQNDSIAHHWFLKSAYQGFIDAQFKVAYNLGTGRGVSLDKSQSINWLRKCAKQGDEECLFQLAGFFKEGWGIEQNADSVFYWAKKLAIKINPEDLNRSGFITSMRLTLAQMYQEGDLFQQDFQKSYMWYLIYNESKIDFSVLQQQSVIAEIKKVETNLTDIQRDLARVKAEEILGRLLFNLENLKQPDY